MSILDLVSPSTARRYQIDERALEKFRSADIKDEIEELGVEPLDLQIVGRETAGTNAQSPDTHTISILEDDLHYIRTAFVHQSLSFLMSGHALHFIHRPTGPYERYVHCSQEGYNTGRSALHPLKPSNRHLIAYHTWLMVTLDSIPLHLTGASSSVQRSWTQLFGQLSDEIERLEDLKEIEWEMQQTQGPPKDEHQGVDTTRYFNFQSLTWGRALAPIYAQAIVAATMNVLYRLPGRATRVLLAGMRDTFRLMLEYARGSDHLTPDDLRLLRFLARDPRTILASFDIEPSIHEYICCPSCFALYPNNASSPKTCTYRSTRTSEPCQTKLWRKSEIRGKCMEFPVRKYLHQSMVHWFGRMVSRAEIEKWLQVFRGSPSGTPMKDIFDGLALRRFTAPGEKTPFLQGPPDELRLIFSLSVDGFNPFQMKEAKQTVTSTAIYMVCLNLPPHLRYRPENMYLVGVIPGPTKPSTEQINHFLALLVDDLLLFWQPGVHYSRTALRPFRRRARAAMIPLVCDLLGARQVAGVGAHNHTHMLCTCCSATQDDIEESTTSSPRNLDAHRAAAIEWRDAESTLVREYNFARTGIRWTELLRLQYWNPILYVVVDSMHNLYLGLLQRHIRDIWGISTQLTDGDASGRDSLKAPPRPSPSVMNFGLKCLLHGSNSKLASCAKPVLYHLCVDRNLRRAGPARILLKHLITWREKEGLPQPEPVIGHSDPAAGVLGSDASPSSLHVDLLSPIVGPPGPGVAPLTPGIDPPPPGVDISAPSLDFPVNDEQVPNLQHRPKLVGSGSIILERVTSAKALIRRGLPTLREMCKMRGLPTGGTRAMLADRLWDWRQMRQQQDLSLASQDRLTGRGSAVMPGSWPSTAPEASQDIHDPPQFVQGLPEHAGPTTMGCDSTAAPQTASDPATMQTDSTVFPPTAALGRETLNEYVRDRANMQLPSWVNPAPLAFGTTQHGKLSADQWRTVSTINLPITLIRTWGLEGGRRSDMLRNFLKLVEAIVTLGYWEANIHSLAHVDRLLQEYLEGVKTLYKGAKIQPNHHLSLHLTMFIALFGPVHAWRSFAFERFNFMLQSLNINANFGELEMTFMMQSCRMANLGPILRNDSVEKAMPMFRAAYDQLSEEDRRGMRSDDTVRNGPSTNVVLMGRKWKTPRTVCLDDRVYDALRMRCREDSSQPVRQALTYPAISISGVIYKVQQRSQGDSNIIFRHPSLPSEEPGRIVLIFNTSSPGSIADDTFLAVERLSPLTDSDRAEDPYRSFGETGGSLYYDSYEPGVLVIRSQEIVCHYAKTSMTGVDLAPATWNRPTSNDNALVARLQNNYVHVLRLGKFLRLSGWASNVQGNRGHVETEGGDATLEDVPIA